MRFRYLTFLLLTLDLTACADHRSDIGKGAVAPAPVPPQIVIRRKESTADFDLGSASGPTPATRDAFTKFVATEAGTQPQALHLKMTAGGANAAVNSLSEMAILAGVDRSKIVLIVDPSIQAKTMLHVEAEHFVVVPPSCPNNAKLTTAGDNNDVSSNWGCAYISDLEAMMDDPRDLIEGESGGRTDSIIAAQAVDRLRNENVNPLPSHTLKSDFGDVVLAPQGKPQ